MESIDIIKDQLNLLENIVQENRNFYIEQTRLSNLILDKESEIIKLKNIITENQKEIENLTIKLNQYNEKILNESKKKLKKWYEF